ncbi:hypothetical protein ACFQFG_11200 [Methylobacterium persicinum]
MGPEKTGERLGLPGSGLTNDDEGAGLAPALGRLVIDLVIVPGRDRTQQAVERAPKVFVPATGQIFATDLFHDCNDAELLFRHGCPQAIEGVVFIGHLAH